MPFKSLFIYLIMALIIPYSSVRARIINISLKTWVATIETNGLHIIGHKKNSTKNNQQYVLTENSPDFKQSHHYNYSIFRNYIIHYDNGIKVNIKKRGDHLVVRIIMPKDEKVTAAYNNFNWPIKRFDSELLAYLVPEGEGLYISSNDSFWKNYLINNEFEISQSTLPFIGFLYNNAAINIMVTKGEVRTKFKFKTADGQPEFITAHHFILRDKMPDYEVIFSVSAPSDIAPALEYRKYLKNEKQYFTLKQKIQRNPNIKLLAGAIHGYVWGDGRTKEALADLADLGITRAWLGYEEKYANPKLIEDGSEWNKQIKAKQRYIDQNYITEAKKLGYLIGPYDSWHTMMPKDKADSHNVDFGDFFPLGCVINKNGSRSIGFAGRGCYVSTAALNNMKPANKIVYDRFAAMKNNGINSYFLDCEATGEIFDDYSPNHPQTAYEDLQRRERHLSYLSKQRVVLGSETAAAWAVNNLAFAHGNFSAGYGLHWISTKNKEVYGGWYPQHRPMNFFKETKLGKDYDKRYDPVYRVPLFQTVFHEAIVTTDRWETPITKFPHLIEQRLLLEFLYGVPSMWAFDREQIKQKAKLLRGLAKYFAPYHQKIMGKKIIDYKVLDDRRMVQQIVYSPGTVTVVANFSTADFHFIPAKSMCIKDGKKSKNQCISAQDMGL